MPRHPRGPFRDMPAEVAILTAVSFTVALGFGIVAPETRPPGTAIAVAEPARSSQKLRRLIAITRPAPGNLSAHDDIERARGPVGPA